VAVFFLERLQIVDALFPRNRHALPIYHPSKAESIENEGFVLCNRVELLRLADSSHPMSHGGVLLIFVRNVAMAVLLLELFQIMEMLLP